MEVAMAEAVLKSNMSRMRRRSRMRIKQKRGAREVIGVVTAREMRIKSNSKIANRGVRYESKGEGLVERCTEVSGIFFAWPCIAYYDAFCFVRGKANEVL